MVLAIGYRVRSARGIQFRHWATRSLREYLIKGFVLDDERLKRGEGEDYFDELLHEERDLPIGEFPKAEKGITHRRHPRPPSGGDGMKKEAVVLLPLRGSY